MFFTLLMIRIQHITRHEQPAKPLVTWLTASQASRTTVPTVDLCHQSRSVVILVFSAHFEHSALTPTNSTCRACTVIKIIKVLFHMPVASYSTVLHDNHYSSNISSWNPLKLMLNSPQTSAHKLTERISKHHIHDINYNYLTYISHASG